MILVNILQQITAAKAFTEHLQQCGINNIDSCWGIAIRILPENDTNLRLFEVMFNYGNTQNDRYDIRIIIKDIKAANGNWGNYQVQNLSHPFNN